jgi:hypothetical protein
MDEHTCREVDYCICSPHLYEPNEDCPIHMGGAWPPRCMICGRFMKWRAHEQV